MQGHKIASIANSGTLGGGGSYSHDANGNVTHDGLAGLDLQYNLLNLTKRISSGGTTLADYHYLADGTRAAAERGDGRKIYFAEGSTDSFKKKFHDTVRYMNSKGTAGNLAKLESSEIVYYIKETSSIEDVMFSIKDNNTIYWGPNHLAKTDSEMWLIRLHRR
ncbi:MAG: hypothetical protein MJY86_00745 [Bacteroidales bacterium]|nr:hypothetical protein [Bacteroidales bacterium]